MTNISDAVDNFILICNKYSILRILKEEIKNHDNIKNSITLSHELKTYYNMLMPDQMKIETGFSPIRLFSVDKLKDAQIGYQSLPTNYLVFADDLGGGKPICAILDEPGTPVYANYDTGVPFKISDDFSTFIQSLTELVDIVYGQFDIFDIADDNDTIKVEFVDAIKLRIEPIIGHDNFNSFYEYFYG